MAVSTRRPNATTAFMPYLDNHDLYDVTRDDGPDLLFRDAVYSLWEVMGDTDYHLCYHISTAFAAGALEKGFSGFVIAPDVRASVRTTASGSSSEAQLLASLQMEDTHTGFPHVEEVIDAVKESISSGDYPEAIRGINEGILSYPDNTTLKHYSEVLAQPVVLDAQLKPLDGIMDNAEWLKKHSGEFPGLWVALQNGKLLASSEELSSLIAIVGKRRDILFTKVPG